MLESTQVYMLSFVTSIFFPITWRGESTLQIPWDLPETVATENADPTEESLRMRKKKSHFNYSTATKQWRLWPAWAHRVRGYSASRGRAAPESQRLQMRRQKLKSKPSGVRHTRSAKPSSPLPPSLGKVMSDRWLLTPCSLKCGSFQNPKSTYRSNPSHCLCFMKNIMAAEGIA